jgi:ParB family chromosome partitioning protein
MSDNNADLANKKKGLGRGLGSLLGGSTGLADSNPTQSASAGARGTLADMNKSSDIQNGVGAVSAGAASPVMTMNSQNIVSTQPVSAPVQKTEVAPVNPEARIWQVAVDKLQAGQFQPRSTFEKEALQDLANSIKENGILQPIVARRISSGKLEIVAGERRWRAAQIAGLHEVPVILKSYDDKQALELAIIENIQREDLNPIEEAEGYARLIAEFKLSQQQVAERVGKDRATISNAVRVLSLSIEIRDMVSSGELSVGHAKVLLGLNDAEKQLLMAKKVVAEKIAVRKLEKMVHASNNSSEKEEVEASYDSGIKERLVAGLNDELRKMLGTKVSIDYANSKGKISIHFYSDSELTNIIDKMRDGCQK